MCDILRRLAAPALTKQQYLSSLNEFSRLCRQNSPINEDDNFTMDDVFRCLKTALFHDAAEVRAAALRAIRYLLKDERSVKSLLRVNLPIFIVRSIDIVLENRTERIQALRLVRKLLSISPHLFPPAFTRSLIAIAQDGQVEHDALTRACWALLAELSIMSPTSSTKDTQNCAFNAIMDAALAGNQPHGLCESLISTLLYMLNWPRYRCLIRGDLDLQIFVAPFTDSHYTNPVSKDPKQNRLNQTTKFDIDPYDQRENKFTAAKITLISILRSWQGLIYLCEPQSSECNLVSNSCLKSLINMLYLRYNDVRRRLIDLIFELLYLPLPDSTTDFESGVKFLEKHQLSKDSWKVHDAFVVDEAKAILPPLRSRSRMNLVSDYMALLLIALFNCNIIDALSEVIITPSSQENSVRATILLYQLLSLSYQYLPTDSFSQYLTLSKLIAHATSKVDDSRDLANTALMNLGRVHPLRKCTSNLTSAKCSLFLGQILEFCSPHLLNQATNTSTSLVDGVGITQSLINSSDSSNNNNKNNNVGSNSSAAIVANHEVSNTMTITSLSTIISQTTNTSSSSSTSTLVNMRASSRSPSISSRSPSILSRSPSITSAASLLTMFSFSSSPKMSIKSIMEQEWQSWDWEHINFLLTRPQDSVKKMPSQHIRAFLKRLILFYKPSSNEYSMIDINNERCRQLCETGCNLVDFLTNSSDAKTFDLLFELLHDISVSMHDPEGHSHGASLNNYHHHTIHGGSNNNNNTLPNSNSLHNSTNNNRGGSNTGTLGSASIAMTPVMSHNTDVNILSSSKLITTMSSTYFLFIGRLSSSYRGFRMLEKSSIMKLINNLTQTSMLATSPAEVYVRLIISCFDYTKEFNGSRKLLEKFLFNHPEDSVQIYATNFLRVLLRANVPDFSTWAIELLVRQLSNETRVVHNSAADILDEACDFDENLEGLINLKQINDTKDQPLNVIDALRSNGNSGLLILCRYASSPSGLRYLLETPNQRLSQPLDSVLSKSPDGTPEVSQQSQDPFKNGAKSSVKLDTNADHHDQNKSYLKKGGEAIINVESEFDVELKRWQQVFNYRYVKLVEDVLNNSLTYHQKGEDGKYGRRIDRINPITKNSLLPPHLYGQLALHQEGIDIILSRNLMDPVYEMINSPPKNLHYSEVSLLRFKAALWIIGHVGSCETGYQILNNSRELIKTITSIAKDASVLSLRGTAFYVLGLLGSTEEGAEEMKEYGWIVQKNKMVALPSNLNLIFTKPNDDYAPSTSTNHAADTTPPTDDSTFNHATRHADNNVNNTSTKTNDNKEKDKDEESSGIPQTVDDEEISNSIEQPVASLSSPTGAGSMSNLHPNLKKEYSASQLEQIRHDVLNYVTKLSGAVASRPAENSLLNLKRKFGIVFQYDVALYSEVCNQLARYNFRLQARRFLQELFLDITVPRNETSLG